MAGWRGLRLILFIVVGGRVDWFGKLVRESK